MSVQLHPDIGQLDRSSLCYSIYSQLYHNFFNVQERKSAENPYGIEEGDETSVRLKNTAYGFASAIAGAVTGEGGSGEGGLLLDYLKKSGGDMTGMLRAAYGFEAGVGNTRILETYSTEETDSEGVVSAVEHGIRITGNLRLGGASLYLGERQVLKYDAERATATLDASHLDMTAGTVSCSGEWLFGERESGVFISSTLLQVAGQDVYHRGNANLATVDWTMHDGSVQGDLAVAGEVLLGGALSALHGVRLGDGGRTLLTFSGEDAALSGNLSFGEGFGIRIDGKDVLVRETENRIRLGSIGGDLLLGSDDTPRIRLFSGLSDIDGDCLLVSPYGHACFPGSLTVRHDYGADLLSTYRTDAADEGIILHKRLRMGGADGFLITGDRETLSLTSDVEYVEEGVQTLAPHATAIGHYPSTSRYAPQNRKSESFVLTTDADFVTVGVPLEAAGHVGIDGSATRLANSVLYFTEELRLQAVVGGIKHYGDSLFTGSLSSEFFSSGFAGNGWAIRQNRTTGNVTATFDEVVARRRFRAYEFEVKKISAANGSLWVSDSCSGDTVEKL
jgi:hypothetical protein